MLHMVSSFLGITEQHGRVARLQGRAGLRSPRQRPQVPSVLINDPRGIVAKSFSGNRCACVFVKLNSS